MRDPIGIACLGAARVSPLAITGPAAGRSGVRLSCVAARDKDRAAAFATRHGFARAAADYAEAVEADDVDLVYIALPAALHARWALRAIEAGKHVLCEKPFTLHAQEAHAVVAAAEARGVRVIEAVHTRYHPLYRQMLRLVRRGDLGSIRTIKASFDAPIPYRDAGGRTDIRRQAAMGGGAMADLGCYLISWTLDLTGEVPEKVTAIAMAGEDGVDEAMHARLDFRSGVRADLRCSMAPDRRFGSSLEVGGQRGTAVLDAPVTPTGGQGLDVIGTDRNRGTPPGPQDSYHYQMEAVLRGLRTGRLLPTEGPGLVLRQAVLDRVYAASGLGRARAAPSPSLCSP